MSLLFKLVAAFSFQLSAFSFAAEPLPEFPADCGGVGSMVKPCDWSCNNGKHEDFWKAPQYFCDYLLSHDRNALNFIHDIKDPAGQRKFIEKEWAAAQKAWTAYVRQRDGVLAYTAPKNARESDPVKRLAKLTEFRQICGQAADDAKAFLGYQESAKYVAGKTSPYANDWNAEPYLTAYDARIGELDLAIKGVGDEVAAVQRAKVDKIADPRLAKLKGAPVARQAALLNGHYDGNLQPEGDRPALTGTKEVVNLVKAKPAGGSLASGAKGADSAGRAFEKDTAAPPAAPAAPPLHGVLPENGEETAKRNYFSRGLKAGVGRISDDTALELRHRTGKSYAVGDPHAKANLAFQQEDGTCSIAATQMYMAAHGETVSIEKVSQKSRERRLSGLDMDTKGEFVGGTYAANVGVVAQNYDHFVVAKSDSYHDTPKVVAPGSDGDSLLKQEASRTGNEKALSFWNRSATEKREQERLDIAVRKHRGAVVSVDSGILWGDKPSNGSDHSVFVTGEEVNKDGSIHGYYINDSGTGEGGRFVPAKVFVKAWRASWHSMAVMESHEAPDIRVQDQKNVLDPFEPGKPAFTGASAIRHLR